MDALLQHIVPDFRQLVMPNAQHGDICSLGFLWFNLQQRQETPIQVARIHNFLVDMYETHPKFRDAFPSMVIVRRLGIERQYAGPIVSTCLRCRTPSRALCHACDECAISLWEQRFWDLAPIVNQKIADEVARNQFRDIGNADIIALAPFAI